MSKYIKDEHGRFAGSICDGIDAPTSQRSVLVEVTEEDLEAVTSLTDVLSQVRQEEEAQEPFYTDEQYKQLVNDWMANAHYKPAEGELPPFLEEMLAEKDNQ